MVECGSSAPGYERLSHVGKITPPKLVLNLLSLFTHFQLEWSLMLQLYRSSSCFFLASSSFTCQPSSTNSIVMLHCTPCLNDLSKCCLILQLLKYYCSPGSTSVTPFNVDLVLSNSILLEYLLEWM